MFFYHRDYLCEQCAGSLTFLVSSPDSSDPSNCHTGTSPSGVRPSKDRLRSFGIQHTTLLHIELGKKFSYKWRGAFYIMESSTSKALAFITSGCSVYGGVAAPFSREPSKRGCCDELFFCAWAMCNVWDWLPSKCGQLVSRPRKVLGGVRGRCWTTKTKGEEIPAHSISLTTLSSSF